MSGFELVPGDPETRRWQRLSEVEMKSVEFLDKPLWQANAFHLVVGRSGQGKGTMLADLAARVTRGELGEKRNVVWIATEDSAAIDVHPRLVAASGDPERVLVLDDFWPQLPRDLDEIEAAVHELGDVGALFVDPVANHVAGKDTNTDDVRAAIGPLNKFADEYGCLVIGVRHLTEKDVANSSALSKILGASAWVQVPRAVVAVVKDPADADVSHVQVIKGNRLPPGTPGRRFRIDGVPLPGLTNDVTRCVWLGDSSVDVEDLLVAKPDKEISKSKRARELVLDLLEAAAEMTIESDALDAEVARQVDLAAGTVRNVRTKLKEAGLIRFVPERDQDGTPRQWFVVRTAALRT